MAEAQRPEGLEHYAVQDSDGVSLGVVLYSWLDAATSRPEFIGVGNADQSVGVIPVEGASVDDDARLVSVPFSHNHVLAGPVFAPAHPISDVDEVAIYTYYGMKRSTDVSSTGYVEDNEDFRESERVMASPPEVDQ